MATPPSARRPSRRRPLRVTVIIPPRLADVLDGLAVVCGQSPAQAARSLVRASLVEARHDPAVQAALSTHRGGVGPGAGEGRPRRRWCGHKPS
jgi:hypothetical protein